MADAMAMRFALETEPIPGARTRTYSRASVLEKHAHWGGRDAWWKGKWFWEEQEGTGEEHDRNQPMQLAPKLFSRMMSGLHLRLAKNISESQHVCESHRHAANHSAMILLQSCVVLAAKHVM